MEANTPRAIFFKILGRIETRLKKAERPRAFKNIELANRLRGELFSLEGWAKIHCDWPVPAERKVFERIRAQAKLLEDALGQLDLMHELASDLEAKGQTDLVALFESQGEAAWHQLKHVFKARDWFSHGKETRIDKIRQQLESIDWPSSSAQKDFLIQVLIKNLAALGARYRDELKPKLLSDVYDRKSLENGLHKFRRQLRWFSMYFQTSNGLISLGPLTDRLTVEKRKVVADYKDHPFAVLPQKRIASAQIDPVAFYELTRLVDLTGRLKDRAERYFYVRDCLIENGSSAPDAESRVRLIYGDAPREVANEMRALMDEYERLKPLSYLSESLADS